jgi:hypothetical protein
MADARRDDGLAAAGRFLPLVWGGFKNLPLGKIGDLSREVRRGGGDRAMHPLQRGQLGACWGD